MPVMGPNLQSAREEGNRVAQKLLGDLIEEHHLSDVTASRYEGSGIFFLPHAEDRWDKAKQDFVKSVEELFVEDASNSF